MSKPKVVSSINSNKVTQHNKMLTNFIIAFRDGEFIVNNSGIHLPKFVLLKICGRKTIGSYIIILIAGVKYIV